MTPQNLAALVEGGPWHVDYIEDAATARRSIYRRDGSLFTNKASNYDPPANGVHLCGVTDDEGQPTTMAVYRMAASEACEAFEAAKAVAECDKDAADFVVDLCIADSIENDFWSNRQVWPRAIEAWNALASRAIEAGRSSEGES
jgi:hypothetical protein